MDFETRYSPGEERERESFRATVRAWLADHAQGVGAPADAAGLSYEQFQRNRAFLRALGERGWYAPTWSKEYGGGGLTKHLASVVREELEARIEHIENVHPPGDIGGSAAGAVWHAGDDDQKRRFLPPILRGEVITWELHSEPDAGSDLPSLKSTARREGDVYILNGTKAFAGGHYECDQFFWMGITNPDRPRRENLSVLLVPADLPGISMTDLDMIAGSRKRLITFEDVRVPVTQLIGTEGDGWTAFNVGLREALSVGIGPGLDRGDKVFELFLQHCRETAFDGEPLSARPQVRDELARMYVELQVLRLLHVRNAWMDDERIAVTYEGAQAVLGRKRFDLRLAEAMHRALGPLAVVSDPGLAPFAGELEYFHRYAILMAHPGGTVEIQKLRMFRGMEQQRAGSARA
jgi:alkylation response protein AidB-like acyl-CoA dehydrogenase